jgi:hypothetical protein
MKANAAIAESGDDLLGVVCAGVADHQQFPIGEFGSKQTLDAVAEDVAAVGGYRSR